MEHLNYNILMDIFFTTILAGCACTIVFCITFGAVTITSSFVRSFFDN